MRWIPVLLLIFIIGCASGKVEELEETNRSLSNRLTQKQDEMSKMRRVLLAKNGEIEKLLSYSSVKERVDYEAKVEALKSDFDGEKKKLKDDAELNQLATVVNGVHTEQQFEKLQAAMAWLVYVVADQQIKLKNAKVQRLEEALHYETVVNETIFRLESAVRQLQSKEGYDKAVKEGMILVEESK